MRYEKLEIDQIIYEQFEKKDKTQQESYGQYLVATQKKEEFFKKLDENQQNAFNDFFKAYEKYEEENAKEFVRFVISFIRNVFR